MRVRRYGEDALLAEPDDATDVLALAGFAAGLVGVSEVVPAARTVLVLAHRTGLRELEARLHDFRPGPSSALDGTEVLLDVVYDGDDLADTAREAGLDVDGLVRAHAAASYVVAFCGFVPGFAYLTGLDPSLHLSRLAEPRTRVPAGSVGIAGEFSGVYPRASPGGWRLLGRTDARLWDVDREPPALLAPGTRVRFRPT